jgi:hypothetical protein
MRQVPPAGFAAGNLGSAQGKFGRMLSGAVMRAA